MEMNLRDIFAVHAMAALITSPKVQNPDGDMTTGQYAALAYIMADTMIAQRDFVPPKESGYVENVKKAAKAHEEG